MAPQVFVELTIFKPFLNLEVVRRRSEYFNTDYNNYTSSVNDPQTSRLSLVLTKYSKETTQGTVQVVITTGQVATVTVV